MRGQRLVDAAVFEPVPVRSALRDGCTHALVLCTRPATLHTSWRKLVRGTVVHMVKSTVLNAPYMRPAFAAQVGSNSALETQVRGQLGMMSGVLFALFVVSYACGASTCCWMLSAYQSAPALTRHTDHVTRHLSSMPMRD